MSSPRETEADLPEVLLVELHDLFVDCVPSGCQVLCELTIGQQRFKTEPVSVGEDSFVSLQEDFAL
jgi:hypothetical protein